MINFVKRTFELVIPRGLCHGDTEKKESLKTVGGQNNVLTLTYPAVSAAGSLIKLLILGRHLKTGRDVEINYIARKMTNTRGIPAKSVHLIRIC